MAILYFVGGLAASGKTTYINEILEEDSQVLIARNQIRLELVPPGQNLLSKEVLVNNTFIDRITDALENDYDVFAEDMFLTADARAKFLRRIPRVYDEVHLWWFNVDKSTCVAQNDLRITSREYIDPKLLKRLSYNIEFPSNIEPFDNIEIIEPNNAFM